MIYHSKKCHRSLLRRPIFRFSYRFYFNRSFCVSWNYLSYCRVRENDTDKSISPVPYVVIPLDSLRFGSMTVDHSLSSHFLSKV